MQALIMILVFGSSFLLAHTIAKGILVKKNIILIRLGKIARQSSVTEDSELSRPLFERIVRPVVDGIAKGVIQITPKELVSLLEKKIINAGKPFNIGVKEWMNIQLIILLCLPAITIAAAYMKSLPFKNIAFLLIVEIALGALMPNFILSRKISERQKNVMKTLPDLLDLLTVSVEAGLGFDSALSRVIEKMPGPLSQEFANVLQEIKVGKQKKDALKDMSERLNVQDVTSFINSVIQADKLGVSIGNVLRVQSEQMRQKRKQRAQEKAMKAPVKMLIPMLIFIFPTIFSVLLGPIVLRIIDVFMK